MKPQNYHKAERMVFLTQNEIDTIFFTIKNFVKFTANVDRLYELDEQQRVDYRNELKIIEKFSKL